MRRESSYSASPLALLASSSTAQGFRQIDLDVLQDKMRGAWAGQMIGVSYGAPYEFHYQGSIMEDPIRDWEPGFVDNSIHQDDLYVEMTFLRALEVHGLDITYEQAGQAFADSQYGLWHANYYGRENCRNGIMPPLSGDPFHNAHFDDIDYQIEADFGGIICPGMPLASNRISDVFGHVMNYGDGVYGGMWVAAMYAEAYFESDVEAVVRRALLAIPAESTYAMLIQDVLDFHAKEPDDWRACWQMLEDKWGHVDLCPEGRGAPFNIDAKLNGGYIAMGLLYGDGDWEETLVVSTRCGQDNDCNPSNAAGVLGCILGYEGIPEIYRRSIPSIAERSSAIPTTASIVSPMSAPSWLATSSARGRPRPAAGRPRGLVRPAPSSPGPGRDRAVHRRGCVRRSHRHLRQWSGAPGVAARSLRASVCHSQEESRSGRLAPRGQHHGQVLGGHAVEPGMRYEYALSADLTVRGEPTTSAVTGALISPDPIDTRGRQSRPDGGSPGGRPGHRAEGQRAQRHRGHPQRRPRRELRQFHGGDPPRG